MRDSVSVCSSFKPLTQHREARRNVRAPETHPQAVIGHGTELGPIDARRKEQNAGFLDEPARELFDALRALVADEADATAVGLAPVEQMPVLGEKRVENGQVVAHHPAIPLENLLTRLERDSRKHLGRRRVAYGQKVLVSLESDQRRAILASKPADAQPRQPIPLR